MKHLVVLHKGTIHFVSWVLVASAAAIFFVENKGSIVTLRFPIE